MADFIHGVVRYPGALSVEGGTYTLSHGISPGCIILKMNPQPEPPADFGDVVFTDGNEEVIIPDCKLSAIKVDRDDKGLFWSVEILDRRWRWQYGFINGSYNQLDPFGHLIPWTIRSPAELAALCLTAMGETDYTLQLPPGLNYPGPNAAQPPVINVSGVNPPVNWEGVPPAQALQQVADRCGCRIIYQLATDSVLVAPIGQGDDLPGGSIHKRGPTLTAPGAPSAVGVIGDPTRYQARLALTPVGKEWDGSYRPINLLSYAPRTPGQAGKPQISTVTCANYADNTDWKIILLDNKGDPHTVVYSSVAGDNLATVCAKLAAEVNASPDPLWQAIRGAAAAPDVTLTSKRNGYSFNVEVSAFIAAPPNPAPSMTVALTQAALADIAGGVSWAYSMPPLFPNVIATDRLTAADAQRLAQESVFRTYQLSGIDVSGSGPPYIPGLGHVARTQQIVLTDSQVDQIVPQPADSKILLSNPTVLPPNAKNAQDVNIPLTVNFYNGFSHDKPAVCYGQIAQQLVMNNVWYPDALGQLNTPFGSEVLVPFSVDPEFFLVRFSEAVYMLNVDGTVQPPDLTLQTAVLVRDSANNQLVSFTRVVPLPGGDPSAPPAMRHYPDIQANVTSAYDKFDRLVAWSIFEADPIARAQYYLAAMMAEYQIKGGQSVEYNGIRALDVDGLTWQVTWQVGNDGCSTVASQNCEHSIWVPPYPARRRAEYLPPVAAVNGANGRINPAVPPAAGPVIVRAGGGAAGGGR